jgi:hypothetical protein
MCLLNLKFIFLSLPDDLISNPVLFAIAGKEVKGP